MPHVPGRLNIVNMSVLSKASHRFNANPNKTSVCLHTLFVLFLDFYNSLIRDDIRMGDI